MSTEAGGSELEARWLLSAGAVREKAHAILEAIGRGESEHFSLDSGALPTLVERVARLTQSNYPDLDRVPYHSRLRHFEVGFVVDMGWSSPRRMETTMARVSS